MPHVESKSKNPEFASKTLYTTTMWPIKKLEIKSCLIFVFLGTTSFSVLATPEAYTPTTLIKNFYNLPINKFEYSDSVKNKQAQQACDAMLSFFQPDLVEKKKTECRIKNFISRYPFLDNQELGFVADGSMKKPLPIITEATKTDSYSQVKVTFKGLYGPQFLYCLVFVNGGWKIANLLIIDDTPLTEEGCPYTWIKTPSDQDKQAMPKKCWNSYVPPN